MLPFYFSKEMTPAIEIKAHEILKNMIDLVLDSFLDNDGNGSVDYVQFFPGTVYEDRPEKCHTVIKDLYFWSKDFIRREEHLTPLHAYALYNVLKVAEDFEEDEISNFFEGLPSYNVPEDEERKYFDYSDLATFGFYFEFYFCDYDFLNIDLFIESIKNNTEDIMMNKADVDFLDFLDLMPIEIEQYYLEKMSNKTAK